MLGELRSQWTAELLPQELLGSATLGIQHPHVLRAFPNIRLSAHLSPDALQQSMLIKHNIPLGSEVLVTHLDCCCEISSGFIASSAFFYLNLLWMSHVYALTLIQHLDRSGYISQSLFYISSYPGRQCRLCLPITTTYHEVLGHNTIFKESQESFFFLWYMTFTLRVCLFS